MAGVDDAIGAYPWHAEWASFLARLWEGDGVHDVLDLCCGTGLLGAELAPRGYRVVGVDASQAMLDVAQARLGPGTPLHRSTLPDLDVDGRFDAAVSIQDGFTYLTAAARCETLVAVASRLRPPGWLVFDLHTEAMLRFVWQTGRRRGGVRHHDRGRCPNRSCDTTIEVTAPEPFTERHRQYFTMATRSERLSMTPGFGWRRSTMGTRVGRPTPRP